MNDSLYVVSPAQTCAEIAAKLRHTLLGILHLSVEAPFSADNREYRDHVGIALLAFIAEGRRTLKALDLNANSQQLANPSVVNDMGDRLAMLFSVMFPEKVMDGLAHHGHDAVSGMKLEGEHAKNGQSLLTDLDDLVLCMREMAAPTSSAPSSNNSSVPR